MSSGPVSTTQWRQIIDSARETAIITLDRDRKVTTWSHGAEVLFGWAESEMLGRELDCLFTQEDRDANTLGNEFKDAVESGRGGGEEGWRLAKDGRLIWAVGELSPIREGDLITGFVKILRDRTEQRHSELRIAEERRSLAVLNRASSSLAVETDLHRLVQIVTDAGVELTGAEFGAFFYNVLGEKGESYMLYTLSGASPEAFAKFPMPRNTAVFSPTFSGERIVRSDDITADPNYGRNAPHKGMPEGHLPVRSYLAIPVLSRDGGVMGGLFFGHHRASVFTERSEQVLAGLAAEASVAIDNAHLALAVKSELSERKRAEEALQALNATLEREVADRTAKLKESEEVLRQTQKMEAIGQLTGGVAHDFNNLLQVIIGNLDTLQRGLTPDTPRLQRATTNAMTGAKRAAVLTERLLAFSRKQPLAVRAVNINQLVGGVSELIRRTLGETIAVDIVQCAGLWLVETDPNALESALINLAVNARDAMPDGGRLLIETDNVELDAKADVSAGQYVLVSVTDSGAGMTSDTLARAFEPFFTTKAVGKGTGLGLSQVYGFVKQTNGHIKITSEIGTGTAIRIYLPRLLNGVVEDAPKERAFTPSGKYNEVILVLEDDDAVRDYSADTLRDLGYTVLEAADGTAAIRILESNEHIDLLFSDVVLPGGMTGAQVTAQAKQLRPRLKVLFTTGYARDAIFHHGRLDEGVTLITKPFTSADLGAKVRDILDQ